MARNSGVTGSNPRPNRPSNTLKEVQKDIDRKEAKWNKARGGESKRTMGSVKPLKTMPPIRKPSGGFQK